MFHEALNNTGKMVTRAKKPRLNNIYQTVHEAFVFFLYKNAVPS